MPFLRVGINGHRQLLCADNIAKALSATRSLGNLPAASSTASAGSRKDEERLPLSGPIQASFTVTTRRPIDLSQALVVMGFPKTAMMKSAHFLPKMAIRSSNG